MLRHKLSAPTVLPHFRYSPFYHSQSWWVSSATQLSTSDQVNYCHISATHPSITVRAGGSVPQLNLLPQTRWTIATFPPLTLLSQSELVAQFRNSTFYLTPGELLPHFCYLPFYHSQSWWRSSATHPSTSRQVSYCHISATYLSFTIRAGGSVP